MDTNTLLKNTSRSLYLSARVLPRKVREAFGIAYLLCRYADTIADTALLPAEKRLYWIGRFAQLVAQQPADEIAQLAQDVCGKSENPYEEELVKNLPLCLTAFNKLSEDLRAIILEVVGSVCEGMELDLSFFSSRGAAGPRAFVTADELKHYCRLMGGKPGLFWSKLIEKTTHLTAEKSDFFAWGQSVGDALQIVNILRDLPKDLQNNRCYFPLEDLEKEGLSPRDLLAAENSARFEPIKQKWIKWGLARLQKAMPYFAQIPKTQPGQRAAVAWPVLWTADTLHLLAQTRDLLDASKRVKIPRSTIYSTMLCTPALWVSNEVFNRWLQRKINRFNR